jgi:deoxyribodipyrimidine photo-lyase
MKAEFTTNYQEVLDQIDEINPIKYGKTRNYIHGDVTYLSPYISRGLISTKQILTSVAKKGYKLYEIESFVKELCWRDYFQRVQQEKNVSIEIKNKQFPVVNYEIPTNIITPKTGIEAINLSINNLYTTGYMHNHSRMYVASLITNIAQCHWLQPARWMYFHLLDGDWASNACSWQWVCAANSGKKYYANQENINRFTNTVQRNSFLDNSVENLLEIDVPESLNTTEKVEFKTILPSMDKDLSIDSNIPTLIYNYYNLDSKWKENIAANRILLLEPEFFEKYPVSEKCIQFILELSKNIENIQVFVGSFKELKTKHHLNKIFYKEHPLNIGYQGIEEKRDFIIDTVIGYYPSFFAYWKKIEKEIKNQYFK